MKLETTDDYRAFLAVLKEHGVTHFRAGDLELTLGAAGPRPARQASPPLVDETPRPAIRAGLGHVVG